MGSILELSQEFWYYIKMCDLVPLTCTQLRGYCEEIGSMKHLTHKYWKGSAGHLAGDILVFRMKKCCLQLGLACKAIIWESMSEHSIQIALMWWKDYGSLFTSSKKTLGPEMEACMKLLWDWDAIDVLGSAFKNYIKSAKSPHISSCNRLRSKASTYYPHCYW